LPGASLYSSPGGSPVSAVLPPAAKMTRLILLDIEGTTTPVTFVYDTLFPFAVQRFDGFLREHWNELATRATIRQLEAQHQTHQEQSLNPPVWKRDSEESQIASAAAYGKWLIAHDSKCGPLKELQGRIWEEGYKTGQLHGQVYDDVPRAFERWRRQNRDIHIYSSGSVLAQQLLFGYSNAGDLTRFICAYFDTRVGPKTDIESYRTIAARCNRPAEACLFISDSVHELNAAKTAGMLTALCVRSEKGLPISEDHPMIVSFDEVLS
jgi:enolase-phosphatase E1